MRTHDTRPQTATDMHHPIEQARAMVAETANEYLGPDDQIDIGDVYVVTFSYILSNWKGLLSTTLPDDKVYEVTHKAGGETFVGVYHKERQRVFDADDVVHNI